MRVRRARALPSSVTRIPTAANSSSVLTDVGTVRSHVSAPAVAEEHSPTSLAFFGRQRLEGGTPGADVLQHSLLLLGCGLVEVQAAKVLGYGGELGPDIRHGSSLPARDRWTDIIRADDVARMKHNAVVGNVGHFDTEVDMAGLGRVPGIERVEIKPQVHEWRFPDGHSVIALSEGRLLNLGNATGHPSFVMSSSFTNQVLAQLELFTKPGQYEPAVYRLPAHLDEKVARSHLDTLGVHLTTLTKTQAEYLGVDDGPYKPDHYRY